MKKILAVIIILVIMVATGVSVFLVVYKKNVGNPIILNAPNNTPIAPMQEKEIKPIRQPEIENFSIK